jgi:hypothetical protein
MISLAKIIPPSTSKVTWRHKSSLLINQLLSMQPVLKRNSRYDSAVQSTRSLVYTGICLYAVRSNWSSSNPSILCTTYTLYTIPLLPGGKHLKYFGQIFMRAKGAVLFQYGRQGSFRVTASFLFSQPMVAVYSGSGNHVCSKWTLFIPNLHQFELVPLVRAISPGLVW